MSLLEKGIESLKDVNKQLIASSTTTKVGLGALGAGVIGAGYLAKKYLNDLPPSSPVQYSVQHGKEDHGGRIFAHVFKNHGVQVVFTLVGGHISPILVGCEELGLKVVDVRHEVNAAFAADAVSRLTGVPGVAIVTAGPGVTNTITAIKNAQIAQSPFILIGGAASDIVKGMGSLQDVDQLSLVKSLVKWYTHVGSVKEIIPAVEKAFWMCKSGTPGPVFLEVPLDVLYSEATARQFYGAKKSAGGSFFDSIANWYMSYHLDKIFGGASELSFHLPMKYSYPTASRSQISTAADYLRKAKRPFLMIGSQTLLQVDQVKSGKLTEALAKLGIPIGLSGMARGLMGKKNSLQVLQKMTRATALKEADVVILAGLPMDFRLDYGRKISGRSNLISVNRDAGDLYMNNMLRKPKLAILGDPCNFLLELVEAVASASSNWEEWRQKLRQSETENEKGVDAKKDEKQQKFIHPIYLCKEIERVAGENAIFVADGGDFVGTAAYVLRPRGPLTWLDPGPFGTLGVGSAFAMGAKLCRPDSEVWVIFGDGAVGFSIAEFDTFVRHKIPVIAIVGNDAAWSQILRDQHKMLKSDVACVLDYTNYQDVVKGLGAEGIIVRDESEVPAALQLAKSIATEKKLPVLVNCLIAKSDFREGSISV